MKSRICLILLSVMFILSISGCGHSGQKSQAEPAFSEKPAPAGTRTIRIRNPQTGRLETRQVPVVEPDGDADAEKPPVRYTTQRVRNPQTGEIITKRVPVTNKSAEPEPIPYPETVIIKQSAEEVYQTIYRFAEEMGFDRDSCGRDHFFQCLRCRTASNINMNFTAHLIDTNETKLNIRIENYKGKEEFSMILKSLQEVLDELEESKSEQ